MIAIDCDQGTPEWLEARIGAVTASRCKDACDTLKNGQLSAKAMGYAAQVAMERVAQVSCDDTFVNFAMRRGTELEPEARKAYEAHSGNLVQPAGIVFTDDRWFGYSTDGFVEDDGAIEIKCPLSPLVVVSMWRDKNLAEYMHQMQMGLWITGRKWIDFVMYDPRLAKVGKSLFVQRVHRNEAFIEQMEESLIRFRRTVDDFESALRLEAPTPGVTAAYDNLLARMKTARNVDEASLIIDEALGLPKEQLDALLQQRRFVLGIE